MQALENGLNPPPPPPKKIKKGKGGKKKFYPVLTPEEAKAAKKFKYEKNKDRNKERKLEAARNKAALEEGRKLRMQAILKTEQAKQ